MVASIVAPTISRAWKSSNGVFTLEFDYNQGVRYVIYYSTNLATWKPVNTPNLVVAAGKAQWSDDGTLTGGVSSRKFYRVRLIVGIIPPTISRSWRSPGGAFTMEFDYDQSANYTVYYSTNLTNWNLLNAPNLVIIGDKAQWSDDGTLTGGVNSRKFYRVRAN